MLQDHKNIIIKIIYWLPLNNRKRLAILIEKLPWLPNRHKYAITVIRDWADSNSNEFHRYIWSNHLGIAKYYEENNAFGAEHLILTRRMLFKQLQDYLYMSNQLTKVKSIFEVGCSSGFMLRYLEKNVFPQADVIEGIDIDEYALDKGRAYLKEHSSKIRLIRADMQKLNKVMKRNYDLILCLGVLMYLKKQDAAKVVKSMINHSSCIIAIADLAHPTVDNANISTSEIRAFDGAYIHNIDKMVQESGGEVVSRRWEGSKMFEGQSIYFLFCRPRKG